MYSEKTVGTFLNSEVKDFARYVIETRACPNITDGFRVGARKAVYAAITGDLKNKDKIKLLALTGNILKLQYLHGDLSLHNTIVQLCSPHISKFHPIEAIGQIGFIRQPKVETAPRYLSVKKSKYLKVFEADKDLWKIQEEEGEKVEPKYFYPIIPTILMYRTSSPGFGFSYRCFSYSLDSIIDNCIKSLCTGSCQDEEHLLIPDIEGISRCNFVYNYRRRIWYSLGEYELDMDNDMLTITDLPYNISFESYEDHLSDLEDKLMIKSYQNLSNGATLKYIIKFQYGGLKRLYNSSKNQFFSIFKLYSKVPKDILNVIDMNECMVNFETPYQLIDRFIKNRLVIYEKRKTLSINNLEREINEMSELIRFISLVISGELVINNRPINDIKKDLDNLKLPYKMLKVVIEKLTKDEIDALKNKITESKKYLEYLKKTPTQEMYLDELISMKQNYSGIKNQNNENIPISDTSIKIDSKHNIIDIDDTI